MNNHSSQKCFRMTKLKENANPDHVKFFANFFQLSFAVYKSRSQYIWKIWAVSLWSSPQWPSSINSMSWLCSPNILLLGCSKSNCSPQLQGWVATAVTPLTQPWLSPFPSFLLDRWSCFTRHIFSSNSSWDWTHFTLDFLPPFLTSNTLQWQSSK